MKYKGIGTAPIPNVLNANITIEQLVGIIIRHSRLTSDEIEKYLLITINAMICDDGDKQHS